MIHRVGDGKTVKSPKTWYKKRHKCLAMAHAALIEEERKAAYIASLKAGSANIADKRASGVIYQGAFNTRLYFYT